MALTTGFSVFTIHNSQFTIHNSLTKRRHFFSDATQQVGYATFHIMRRTMGIRQPYEGQQQLTIGRHRLTEHLLVATEGFSDLPLHTVTIDGMVETLLGNADKHLNRCIVGGTLRQQPDGTQGISGHGTAATAAKQLLNQPTAD